MPDAARGRKGAGKSPPGMPSSSMGMGRSPGPKSLVMRRWRRACTGTRRANSPLGRRTSMSSAEAGWFDMMTTPQRAHTARAAPRSAQNACFGRHTHCESGRVLVSVRDVAHTRAASGRVWPQHGMRGVEASRRPHAPHGANSERQSHIQHTAAGPSRHAHASSSKRMRPQTSSDARWQAPSAAFPTLSRDPASCRAHSVPGTRARSRVPCGTPASRVPRPCQWCRRTPASNNTRSAVRRAARCGVRSRQAARALKRAACRVRPGPAAGGSHRARRATRRDPLAAASRPIAKARLPPRFRPPRCVRFSGQAAAAAATAYPQPRRVCGGSSPQPPFGHRHAVRGTRLRNRCAYRCARRDTRQSTRSPPLPYPPLLISCEGAWQASPYFCFSVPFKD